MPRAAGIALALLLAGPGPAGAGGVSDRARTSAIAWTDWSEAAFARAKREHRLVLLDLEAVWCHWCHVMDETTYRDPTVTGLIRDGYVPVRVDQDARPDLANRYEDYGWPATILFDGDGTELAKLSGYLTPLRMASLLRAFSEDPTPGPSAAARPAEPPSAQAALAPPLRGQLEAALAERYDGVHGGWGFVHKYLPWDNVEYSLVAARGGDRAAEARARETLAKMRALVDPVWGGVYQYSDSGDWEHPHFEKIMSMQAEDLRIYAQAYALWHEPAHLEAALAIHRFLTTFLLDPSGAFYTSQDADVVPGEHSAEYFALPDAARRERGVPRVDTHRYARENGWAASGLVALYAATGERAYLDAALAAVRFALEERSLPGGGFRHDDADPAGPYLGDTLACGRAFLALYAATADRTWLSRAGAAAAFIDARFRRDGVAGYLTSASSTIAGEPAPQRDENVMLARFANLLSRYTGKIEQRRMAEHALRFLATPGVALKFDTGGPLLADLELRADPLHLTVVGSKDDPLAWRLLEAALADPAAYKRVELLDEREGPLPNQDVEYPRLRRTAAFVCSGDRCSPPAHTPEELRARIERLGFPGLSVFTR